MTQEILDKIFKAYDIRGTTPDQLNEQFFYNLGKAYATHFKPNVVAAGYDIRPESKDFHSQLVKGLTEMGVDVWNVGEIATEVLYFTAGEYKDEVDGGLVVTASHNPAGWNGCKMVAKGAVGISLDTGGNAIKEIIINSSYKKVSEKTGEIISKDVMPQYKQKVLSFIDKDNIKPLRLVVDAGNGIGGKLFDYVFGDFPFEVEKMYFEPDGAYPNHVPSPMEEENVAEIREKMKSGNFDLGIAIDGDADRVAFIDGKARRPNGAYVGTLIAMDFAQKEPNAKFTYDLRLKWPFVNEVKKVGGIPVVTKVGHSFIKQVMRKENAVFGCEMSLHNYFRDYYFADSGMVTVAVVLNSLFKGIDFTRQIDYFYETYPQSGEVNYMVKDATEVFNKIKETYGEFGKLEQDFDGVSYDMGDWRFSVRSSNTQPLMRLVVEAKTKELLIEKFLEVEKFFEAERENLPELSELQ